MTAKPQRQITMFRGDSLVLEIVVKQSDVPTDLTGAKVWFTAKRTLNDLDGSAIIQVSSPADITIDPDQVANPGKATIVVPASATATLGEAALQLFYDIQVKFSNGRVATVQFGQLLVTPDVTQTIS